MKPLRLSVELTTPGFLGGANPAEDCEWRAASVRGQLRWWFRAVAGGWFQGDLKKVREVEERVFGSTGRSSAVTVSITGGNRCLEAKHRMPWGRGLGTKALAEVWGLDPEEHGNQEILQRLHLRFAVNPVGYLGGQGIFGYEKGKGQFLARPCLEAETEATLTLRVRPGRKLREEDRELFDHALCAWLHLGGLGARTRRGFGSLAVQDVDGADGIDLLRSPADVEDLAGRLRSLLALGEGSSGVAEWSHLSSASRICLAPEPFPSWEEAMVHAGAWLMAFRRRYGISKIKSQQRDYHWAKEARRGNARGVPDRAGFGLPLPFYSKPDVIVNWEPPKKEHRRASPLLLHIARLEDGFRLIFTHLPALLVPPGERVGYQEKPRPAWSSTPEQLGIVTAFLDDLVAKGKLRSLTP